MSEHTVLLGEDDEWLREMFAGWLEESYRVERVAAGDDLLDALGPGVDAVVYDWHIRGTGRTALLDALGETSHDPAVVVVSGVTPTLDLSSRGVDAFLEKPFMGDTLRATVQSAVACSPTVAGRSERPVQ